jgi:hypothetical protein
MQDSHIDEPNASKSKIFEVVTTFTVPEGINVIRRQSGEVDLQDLAFKTRSTGIVSLYIFSQAIINALRSVVDYYPSVDLSREPIVIKAPYAVLVHYEEELAQFSLKCSKLPQERLCAREKDAVEHLGLLRKYLEGTIMPDVVAERVRNKRGFQTYEMMWLRHRPGALILSRWAGGDEAGGDEGKGDEGKGWRRMHLQGHVIHSTTTFADHFEECIWSLDYNGETLGRRLTSSAYARFAGEVEIGDIFCFGELKSSDEEVDKKILWVVQRGKKYFDLLEGKCQYHNAPTATFPKLQVESLVMVDMKEYYNRSTKELAGLAGHNLSTHGEQGIRPLHFMRLTDDNTSWVSDCICSVCRSRKQNDEAKGGKSLFAEYDKIFPQDRPNGLSNEMYFLLPAKIQAYVFKTRTWGNHASPLKFVITDVQFQSYCISITSANHSLIKP